MKHINLLHPKLNALLYAERVNGRMVQYGLKPTKEDIRDFTLDSVGIFGLGEYTPNNQRLVLPTLSIKDQGPLNTCGWNSVTAQKECDEHTFLSVCGLVCEASEKGYVGDTGLSDLRDNQIVVQKFGIPEDVMVSGNPYGSWAEYSNINKLNSAVRQNAYIHRSASFFSVRSRNEILKMLDSGRTIATGMAWYSGYNARGGFSKPWLITGISGVLLGGHAFLMIGYDLNYYGRKVYIFQNSYGSDWGDNGKFYVDMDFFDKVSYMKFVQLDIPLDTASFLNTYNGKNVKIKGSPAIYFIGNGERKAYPDWMTFEAYYGTRGGYEELTVEEGEVLKAIKDGGDMDITQSPIWYIIKDVSSPENQKRIQMIIANKRVSVLFDPTKNQWVATGLDSINF